MTMHHNNANSFNNTNDPHRQGLLLPTDKQFNNYMNRGKGYLQRPNDKINMESPNPQHSSGRLESPGHNRDGQHSSFRLQPLNIPSTRMTSACLQPMTPSWENNYNWSRPFAMTPRWGSGWANSANTIPPPLSCSIRPNKPRDLN